MFIVFMFMFVLVVFAFAFVLAMLGAHDDDRSWPSDRLGVNLSRAAADAERRDGRDGP
jgi:hypothetical protein